MEKASFSLDGQVAGSAIVKGQTLYKVSDPLHFLTENDELRTTNREPRTPNDERLACVPSRGVVGFGASVLMSLKFSTVLNSMLNSPKFCHR